MKNNKINLWRYPNFIKILEDLYTNGGNKITNIALNSKIAHSNTSNSLKILKGMKLVESQMKGRETFYELTNKGSDVALGLIKIDRLLE